MPRWSKVILVFFLGLAGGLVYGWLVDPVKYVDTSPDYLRLDYRTDYVLMIAESFSVTNNTEEAFQFLASLSPQPPIITISEAINYAETAGYSTIDLALMRTLLDVMHSVTSGVSP